MEETNRGDTFEYRKQNCVFLALWKKHLKNTKLLIKKKLKK